jgi:hypothetical protein
MKNDFDRMAQAMREALAEFIGNMHEPQGDSNSITITKDGALAGIIKLQRAIDWCQGHADSRRVSTGRSGDDE